MIKATLVGDDKLKDWLKTAYPRIKGELNQSMARLVIALTRKVKQEKLSGQVLKNRTGTLRRSISPFISSAGENLTGKVGTNLEYAAIHEFGGVTKPHTILPKRGKALLFATGGEYQISAFGQLNIAKYTRKGKLARRQAQGAVTFAKKVNHPGSVIPERSFLRTALNEMTPEIRAAFENAVTRVIRP